MTVKIEISEELEAYFSNRDTYAAVNFTVNGADSNWDELSFNEFDNNDFSEYKNYSDAWIYSKKIQKDYFDFLADLWARSWALLISENLKEDVQVANFEDIDSVWGDSGWHRVFKIKSPKAFDEIWLYCESIQTNENLSGIKLMICLGKDEGYEMKGLKAPTSDWEKEKDGGDHYFVKILNAELSNKSIKIEGIDVAMKEAKAFLLKEAFKS